MRVRAVDPKASVPLQHRREPLVADVDSEILPWGLLPFDLLALPLASELLALQLLLSGQPVHVVVSPVLFFLDAERKRKEGKRKGTETKRNETT